MKMIRGLVVGVALLGTVALAPSARAQVAAAEALFEEGRVAMEAQDYATACERFRESDKLDPAVGTKFNLANCEEQRGQLATAWELFKAVVRALDANDERRPVAEERAKALEPRVPYLTIRLDPDAPKSTVVRVADAVLSSGSFGVALPMDPGRYDLAVSAPGYAGETFVVELTEGEEELVEVSPGDESGAGAGPAGTTTTTTTGPGSDDPTADSGGLDRRTLGFVIGGAGAGLLAGSLVTGLMTMSKKDVNQKNCFPEQGFCNPKGRAAAADGQKLGAITTTLLVAGAAGVGVGTYFIITGGKDEPESAVAVHAGPSGARASFVHAW